MTVESPSGRHLLRLQQDARVEDLLDQIVKVCEGRAGRGGWRLKPRGESVLAGHQTLGDLGLFPGAVLQLLEPEPVPAPTPQPDLPASTQRRRRDFLGSLEDAITTREISRSMVVAVMSSHPGSGTTTVAALLATLLGRLRQDAVTVADANPESGALSHWLAPDAAHPDFAAELTPQDVLAAVVGIGDRTSVLPAPTGEVDWPRLIDHLRHLQTILVLDCAAGFRKPACRAAFAAADLIVLVTRSPHHTLEVPAGKTVVVVENQSERRVRSARTGGSHTVTVVDEPAAAARLKTRGFSWDRAPASWRESISELAAVLVGSAS